MRAHRFTNMVIKELYISKWNLSIEDTSYKDFTHLLPVLHGKTG